MCDTYFRDDESALPVSTPQPGCPVAPLHGHRSCFCVSVKSVRRTVVSEPLRTEPDGCAYQGEPFLGPSGASCHPLWTNSQGRPPSCGADCPHGAAAK